VRRPVRRPRSGGRVQRRRHGSTPVRRATILRITDRVAWVTLPGDRIDVTTAQAVCDAVEEIGFDESVRVAVVRGTGRSFCRGVVDGGDWETRHDWIAAVGSLAVPVLAAIAGDAIAEGAELALACDLRIASRAARFAFPQMIAGRLPRHGATQRLPRLVGRMRALDLLLSGRPIGAREAEQIGLVSRVASAGKLDTAVRQAVAELSAKGPIALRLAKEAVLKGADLTFEQGVRLEQDLYVLLQTTADRAEGISAFLRRRQPRFKGK
jgi:enoyl-CoA hydratase/carnithine racemase